MCHREGAEAEQRAHYAEAPLPLMWPVGAGAGGAGGVGGMGGEEGKEAAASGARGGERAGREGRRGGVGGALPGFLLKAISRWPPPPPPQFGSEIEIGVREVS